MRLEKQFSSFKMFEGKTYQESINYLNCLVRELKEVGIEKSDMEKVQQLLTGITPKLKLYLPIWKTDKTLTYGDLCAQIINIEQEESVEDTKEVENSKKIALVTNKKDYRSFKDKAKK